MLAPGALDEEHLRLAPGVGKSFGQIVDRPLVAAVTVGNELGREGVKVGLGDELLEREDVDAALKVHGHGLLVAGGRYSRVVGSLKDLERAVSRLAGADHHVDVDRLTLLDIRG